MSNEPKKLNSKGNIKIATKNIKQTSASIKQSESNIKLIQNSTNSSVKKEFILEGLGCANCASKMEQKLSKLDGIKSASISFVTKTLFLEIEEINRTKELIAATKEVVKSVEN